MIRLNYRPTKRNSILEKKCQVAYYEKKFLSEGVLTQKKLKKNIQIIKDNIKKPFHSLRKSSFENPGKIKSYIYK